MDKVEEGICNAAAEGPAHKVPEGGDKGVQGRRHWAGLSSQSRNLSSHSDKWDESLL